MRLSLIAGVVLILAGSFLLYNGGSFTTKRDLLKVGDFKVTTEEEHPVAPWIAGAVIIAGVVLVVAGGRRRG